MRRANVRRLATLAREHPGDKFCEAVVGSTSPGSFDADGNMLGRKLQSMGLMVMTKEAKDRTHVEVREGVSGRVVASGASNDLPDAMLHAAYGYVRECRIRKLIADGIDEAVARQAGVHYIDTPYTRLIQGLRTSHG